LNLESLSQLGLVIEQQWSHASANIDQFSAVIICVPFFFFLFGFFLFGFFLSGFFLIKFQAMGTMLDDMHTFTIAHTDAQVRILTSPAIVLRLLRSNHSIRM
jgi:hypothetical protein